MSSAVSSLPEASSTPCSLTPLPSLQEYCFGRDSEVCVLHNQSLWVAGTVTLVLTVALSLGGVSRLVYL